MTAIAKPDKGTWVLLSFVAFFGVIIAVNTVFITNALNSYSGVVISKPYEKGLEYNSILEKARSQPDVEHKVTYEGSELRLDLPISGAHVEATFFRPTKSGMDFTVPLIEQRPNIYTAKPNAPLPGAWTVKLKAQWDDQIFQIARDVIVK